MNKFSFQLNFFFIGLPFLYINDYFIKYIVGLCLSLKVSHYQRQQLPSPAGSQLKYPSILFTLLSIVSFALVQWEVTERQKWAELCVLDDDNDEIVEYQI